jgi:hypothetical protein
MQAGVPLHSYFLHTLHDLFLVGLHFLHQQRENPANEIYTYIGTYHIGTKVPTFKPDSKNRNHKNRADCPLPETKKREKLNGKGDWLKPNERIRK